MFPPYTYLLTIPYNLKVKSTIRNDTVKLDSAVSMTSRRQYDFLFTLKVEKYLQNLEALHAKSLDH